jgi:chemotaxis protein methyltransferase CheR
MIEEVGVIDTRKVIAAAKAGHGLDLACDSLTALRYRIAYAMNSLQIRSIEDLCMKLSSTDFFDSFMEKLTVDETEFFRDPSFWRELKKVVFPRFTSLDKIKIWLPNCSSGEELYTLLICLKEEGLLDKAEILASQVSSKKNSFIKTGIYQHTRDDVNSANYKRANGTKNFADYIETNAKKFQIDTNLLQPVRFSTSMSVIGSTKEQFDFVLYRNSLLYFNKTIQNELVDFITGSLLPNGILAIGVMESLYIVSPETKFREIGKNESIYQKIAR